MISSQQEHKSDDGNIKNMKASGGRGALASTKMMAYETVKIKYNLRSVI